MAWTATRAQMLTELRARGGYRRSTSLTDEILTPFLNAGIAYTHELICTFDPDFLAKPKQLETEAGDDTVNLPLDFYKFRRLYLLEGDRRTRLKPFQLDDDFQADRAGALRYRLQAGKFRFVPTPSSVEQLELWYVPHATKLVIDADKYDGVNGHEDLVYEYALRLCKERDRMDTSSHDVNIQRLEQRLRTALGDRDQSEPEYVRGFGFVSDEAEDWLP